MPVTFEPKSRRLTLQRVGGYQNAADKSLQLWALPLGGVPSERGPTGPVLFKGVLIQKRL